MPPPRFSDLVEWLIGRDTRESGPALEQALIDGLRAAGADPTRVGVVPTPATGILVGRFTPRRPR